MVAGGGLYVAGAGWKSWVESFPRTIGLSSSSRESSPDFCEFALYQGSTVLLLCVIK